MSHYRRMVAWRYAAMLCALAFSGVLVAVGAGWLPTSFPEANAVKATLVGVMTLAVFGMFVADHYHEKEGRKNILTNRPRKGIKRS
jgi:ABC-type transport system involved in cytochrome c biogenesis permease subunit